jgi:hypothetical protein
VAAIKSRHVTRGAAALLLAGTLACAHAQMGSKYVGGAIGNANHGTGIRMFGGAPISDVFGWEAALTSFGSQTGTGWAGSGTSIWSLGVAATARMPLSRELSAYGKAGPHYLSTSGAGATGSLELGIGVGLVWHFSPKTALRFEIESIGGAPGGLTSLGIEMRL